MEENICRLCAKLGTELPTSKISEINMELQKIVTIILDITLEIDCLVCESCLKQLENILKFKKECEIAQRFWESSRFEEDEDECKNEIIEQEQEPPIENLEREVIATVPQEAKKILIKKQFSRPFREVDGHREYECLDCGNHFLSIQKLKNHRKTCSFVGNEKSKRVGPFQCEYCKKQFPTKVGYKIHRYKHPEFKEKNVREELEPITQTFSCDDCGKECASKNGLLVHKYSVHSGRYKTPDSKWKGIFNVNKKNVEKKKEINDENRKKGTKRPRVCHICGKCYIRETHMMFHEKKKFQCDHCDRSYFIKSDLKEHMNKHLGITFPCPDCNKLFYSVAAKNRHRKTHDDKNRVHQCLHCPKRFLSISDRNVHMQVHTKCKRHECDLCGISFRFRYEVGRHKERYHPIVMHIMPDVIQEVSYTIVEEQLSICEQQYPS